MNDPEESADLNEIRKLYPNLTDEELSEARDNIRQYLRGLINIEERLQSEGKSMTDLVPEIPAEKPEPPVLPNPMSTSQNVIHINFTPAAHLFDARPIWTALKNDPLTKEFGPQALSLATRGVLMRTALQKLRLSLQELYALPDFVEEPHMVRGPNPERIKNDVLLYTDSMFFEFRSFLDLLATFTWNLLDALGKAVPPQQTLTSGKTAVLLDKGGSLRRYDYLLYLCDRLGLSTDWFTFLNGDRNLFTHESAPYCAVEFDPGPPPSFEALIMRTNIIDFATADPKDYFRVSELQSVVDGVATMAPAVQAYIIGQINPI